MLRNKNRKHLVTMKGYSQNVNMTPALAKYLQENARVPIGVLLVRDTK